MSNFKEGQKVYYEAIDIYGISAGYREIEIVKLLDEPDEHGCDMIMKYIDAEDPEYFLAKQEHIIGKLYDDIVEMAIRKGDLYRFKHGEGVVDYYILSTSMDLRLTIVSLECGNIWTARKYEDGEISRKEFMEKEGGMFEDLEIEFCGNISLVEHLEQIFGNKHVAERLEYHRDCVDIKPGKNI